MSSSRVATESLIAWFRLDREENSRECLAARAPVSNCKLPTGVIFAGVETVGLPGLATGSSSCSPSRETAEANRKSTGRNVFNVRHILTVTSVSDQRVGRRAVRTTYSVDGLCITGWSEGCQLQQPAEE